MKLYKILILGVLIFSVVSCKKYLDVIPDNIATIDNAFSLRNQAEKYLFTCYSFLPKLGDMENPAFLGSGEFITPNPGISPLDANQKLIDLAYGQQNKVSPIYNAWDGENGPRSYYQGIRHCNIFLENIGRVPDIKESERNKWIAEVKFLKAYYHFSLLRMYGPIPVIKENLPISASVEEVKVKREPVDTVVNYIVQILDEASTDLPTVIANQGDELGRITKPIALSVKAQVLILAASPLFNGNSDYANFKNKDGQALIATAFESSKWQRAATACKEAIDACHEAGNTIFYFEPPFNMKSLSEATQYCMNIRGAITEDWNSETIWGMSNSKSNTSWLQNITTPRSEIQEVSGALLAATINSAEMFYTRNGVPIEEDKTWDYNGRFKRLKTISQSDKSLMNPNYTTSSFNLDRELRFYADLAFDRSSLFGFGRLDETNLLYLNTIWGQTNTTGNNSRFSCTGYWPKKLINYKNTGSKDRYNIVTYVWPAIRLSNLYLLYAEALNEVGGPSEDVLKWVDLVRKRAGLKGITESWANFSKNPAKPTTKDGLRNIIHRETLIEFMFEGESYWSMRRWKDLDLMNQPRTGWDVFQTTTENFYRLKTIFVPNYTYRDFLFPIKEYDLAVNPNLVQNPKW
ncbi:RagB/SusD family nutrient uptake outer membrane protein [Sphingobacterium multivorum]|uniref:RagB/SusD family nutrient uptake outer membrane protein n=1 Tax=Sphingobacterium multivorum TaxID=28454 RepID=UPI0031BB2E1C